MNPSPSHQAHKGLWVALGVGGLVVLGVIGWYAHGFVTRNPLAVATAAAAVVPVAPTVYGHTCSPSGTSVSISWAPAVGATVYYPRISAPTAAQCTAAGWQLWTDGTTCYPNPDTDTATTINNFPITPGQNYSWWMQAASPAGGSAYISQTFSCPAPVALPPAPATYSHTCNAAGTAVTLTWSAVPGATRYLPRISAPTAAQCTSAGWQIWTTDGKTCYPNPDTDTNTTEANFPITPGQQYSWWVQSVNQAGASAAASGETFTCPAPVSSGASMTYTSSFPAATGATTLTNVSGRYDIDVPASVTLTAASAIVQQNGGQVLFTLPTLHALVAQLTAAQQTAIAASASISSVHQEIASETLQTTGGKPRVAIVDVLGHGNEVLATYLAQCGGASCPDPNPMLVNAKGPDGSFTDATIDNAIMQAISNGANIVNVSLSTCADAACSTGAALSPDDLTMLAYAQASGAVIVVGAGNSTNFVNAFALPSPYLSSVVVVGGTNPSNPNVPDPVTSATADVFASILSSDGTLQGTSFSAPRVAAAIATAMTQTGTTAQGAVATAENAPGILNAASFDSQDPITTTDDDCTSDESTNCDGDGDDSGVVTEDLTGDPDNIGGNTDPTFSSVPADNLDLSSLIPDSGIGSLGDTTAAPTLSKPIVTVPQK